MSKKNDTAVISHGVEALIEHLKADGIEHGRNESARILTEAETKAEWIVSQAKEEAELIRKKAKEEAVRMEHSGREALNTAARDAVLSLRTQLTQRFTGEVRRLVGEGTKEKELLEKMILEVVGDGKKESGKSKKVAVILPRDVMGIEELSKHPEELEGGQLTDFLRLVSRKLVREGVTFGVAEDDRGGLRIHLTDKGMVLDFSDKAIADVLLEHLQPRFRALLEGVVK